MRHIEEQKYVDMIRPQLKDNGAPASITSADTKDWAHLEVLIYVGTTDIATTAAPLLQESDTLASGYVAITSPTTAALADAISATEDAAFFAIDVDLTNDRKRYIKCVLTAGDGTTGTNLAVLGILTRRHSGDHSGLAADCGLTERISA